MLRFVALCFATALASASSEYSPKPPEFGPVYSVRYDETDLLAGTKLAYQLWYNETKNMSLLEHYGARTLVGRPGANTGHGLFILGYYMTSETYLNRWNCWNQSFLNLNYDYYFATQRVMTLDRFHFIGKDVIRGEEADKWQIALPYYKSIISEFTTWVIEKEMDGSQQAVPLGHEIRVFDNYTGEMYYHIVRDYYDFNTSAYDQEIFNIKRGLVNCTVTWPKPHEDQITTRFDQFGDYPWLTATRSEQLENQDHLVPFRPEIFSRQLRYPETLRGPGRWGPPGSLHPVTRAEGRQTMLRGSTPRDPSKLSGALPFPYSDAEVEALSKDLPEEFDWRQHGAVTPVKDGSACLASYAFCATDLVVAALYVQKNRTRLLRLSEQAIMDCSWEFNFGCHGYGGLPLTLEWIYHHGLPTVVDYGKYQKENGKCHLADVKTAATIRGYINVPPYNENALKLAILNHGPVAVGIDGVIYDVYKGGVYNNASLCTWGLEYGLAVGWGVLDGQKYWTIKLSNSHRWGIDGYALIAIDKNVCGVTQWPVYAVV